MFSPTPLLILLCGCTLILYGDRGAVSSNSVSGGGNSGIRHDFGLTVEESGWIFAANMIGVAIAAPAAAQLCKLFNALRIVGAGMLLGAIGCLGTAAAPTFPVLLAFRTLAGLGTGPFIALSPALIDDSAPSHRRSVFLGALFLCLPVGFATGYIWSTFVAAAYGWRSAFLFEAIVMSPLAATALFSPDPNDIKRADIENASSSKHNIGFFRGILTIIKNPIMVFAMLGRAIFLGALGGFSFFGSKAAKSIFHLDPTHADLIFGGVTVLTGSLGSLSGGLILDAVGSNVRSALTLCITAVGISATSLAASYAFSKELWMFAPGFFLGESAMFSISAPATAVLLWTSPSELRPLALAVSEVLNHVLGDVPVPPLLGKVQQQMKNWRLTMCICMAVLGGAAIMFSFALCLHHFKKRRAGVADDAESVAMSDETEHDDGDLQRPLLEP